jgi:hypothetical protein
MSHGYSPTRKLVKPEDAQDEHDDDDKTDEIDDAVHGDTSRTTIHCRIVRVQTKGRVIT